MADYEVIVQNIGKVFEGSNGWEAKRTFNEYVGKSQREEGRAAGEGVDIYKDGHIVNQYTGHHHRHEGA